MNRPRTTLILILALSLGAPLATRAQAPIPNPILFVTQVPIQSDFGIIASPFANQTARMASVARGGDLYIRYPNGSLRNLTAEAGYGVASGLQGVNAIAVRDPAVHWSGTKAVFSMVVGGPTGQFDEPDVRWQLFEVSGLGAGETVAMVRVPNQPAGYNNIAPTYASDGSLIFTSDRPRNGASHLYPQHDEYESSPTVTGLWKIDTSGGLQLLEHAPSGAFDPLVDSFGRVVFSRWDHLQQDQQNDPNFEPGNPNCVLRPDTNPYGTFNYSSEAVDSVATTDRSEVFPELRNNFCRPAQSQGFNAHGFKLFLPWQINQDGTGEETLNHIGRHEMQAYFSRSLENDPNLIDFASDAPGRVENILQLTEDPTVPGRFYAIDAPHFDSLASGQLLRIDAPPTRNAQLMRFEYMTPRATSGTNDSDPTHTGHYRNPLVLANGNVVVAHTSEKRGVTSGGVYQFRLKRLVAGGGGFLAPVENLTAGISKNLDYYSPDTLIHYNGPLWELSPAEVRTRPVPPVPPTPLETPERQAFTLEGVDENAFRNFLRAQGLAVVVMRNVTTRDGNDKQQPYNLRVPGGVETQSGSGTLYDIEHMQFFQADQIRGLANGNIPGRRPLAQYLHDPIAQQNNVANPGGPAGSARIAADGSVALFVPTRRAMVWQSTAPDGKPVVRERFWLTFQPGEIRACGGCHGVNVANQAGQPGATNTAIAFRELLARWRTTSGDNTLFSSGFE